MKLSKVLAICVVAGGLLSSSPAVAEDESLLSVDLGVDVLSDYVFRGQNLFDGLSIQPAASAAYSLGELGTIGGSFWAHFSAEDDSPPEGFTEIDWTVDYEISIDILTLGAGGIFYTFPSGDDAIANTQEFYVSAAVDTLLSPSLTYYRDVDEFKTHYFEFGIEHGIEGADWNLTPSLTFGFAASAERVYKDNGLEFVALGLGSDFGAGPLTVTPSLTMIFEVDDTTDDELVLGLGIAGSL
jgi:hypothetical protein